MKISVLGTGHMGKALVKQLSAHLKEEILWGSRAPESAAHLVEELRLTNVIPTSYPEALQADLIIPAFPASALMVWASENRDQLKGKLVVDISNPFNADFSGFTTNWGESSAEQLQALLPDSIIIGAFKNTFFQVVNEPLHNGRISDVLVTGNDEPSVLRFLDLMKPLPFRFLNAGKLENNRTIERFTLLELELALRSGTYPYISVSMFGIPEPVAAG